MHLNVTTIENAIDAAVVGWNMVVFVAHVGSSATSAAFDQSQIQICEYKVTAAGMKHVRNLSTDGVAGINDASPSLEGCLHSLRVLGLRVSIT